MSSIDGLHDMPEPYPEATVQLPGGGGEIKVHVTQVWAPDDLPECFIVAIPSWEKWTQILRGKEIHGVKPSTSIMWVPTRALKINKDNMSRVWETLIGTLPTN